MQEQNEYYDSYELDEMAKNYHDYMELVEHHNNHLLVKAGNCEVTLYGNPAWGAIYPALKVVKEFDVFKKTQAVKRGADYYTLTTLRLPVGTFIAMTTGNVENKFRANQAFVVIQRAIADTVRYIEEEKAFTLLGNAVEQTHSIMIDHRFMYTTGQMVYPDSFDASEEVCANGIHFFLDEQEAINY